MQLMSHPLWLGLGATGCRTDCNVDHRPGEFGTRMFAKSRGGAPGQSGQVHRMGGEIRLNTTLLILPKLQLSRQPERQKVIGHFNDSCLDPPQEDCARISRNVWEWSVQFRVDRDEWVKGESPLGWKVRVEGWDREAASPRERLQGRASITVLPEHRSRPGVELVAPTTGVVTSPLQLTNALV